MAGRFPGGRPNFARDWSIKLGALLNEHLLRSDAAISQLQATTVELGGGGTATQAEIAAVNALLLAWMGL